MKQIIEIVEDLKFLYSRKVCEPCHGENARESIDEVWRYAKMVARGTSKKSSCAENL